MHEMALTSNLLHIIREEMKKHGASRLLRARVRFGALSNVVPEALSMAFEVLTHDTEFACALLELHEEPILLACGECKKEFSPPSVASSVFAPCPHCEWELGHRVLSGKSLYLEHLEVE
ncbi:MAG: hydrogenase maturation nickel metallochaperone HypA [Desulfovibrio sp.]|jgi:hydrogenase nickel incorporation protein HypA/HybF|nr:hydrogenase maturation nickel metallochaperone HypA [Desulfovibrio sp.]